MESIIDNIISLFSMLNSVKLFGLPLLVWLVIPAFLGIVFEFIGGKKNDE